MKTFIISYIISLGILVAAWFPEVMSRPVDTLPRLAFYIAFPMAVFLSLTLLMAGHISGFRTERNRAEITSHTPANDRNYRKTA